VDILFQWLTDPDNRKAVEQDLEAALDRWGQEPYPNKTVGERIWRTISDRENLEQARQPKVTHKPTVRRFWAWRQVAAILIPLFVITLTWFTREPQPVEKQEGAKASWITKNTARGERLALNLPDGSSIYMHSNTVVRIPENIHLNKVREIYLESGEAFFDIAKVGTPFKVYAAGQEVSVMGTSFTVKNNSNNKVKTNIEVAVLTGKVKVSGEGEDGEILTRGDALKVGQGSTRRWQIADLEKEFAWREGLLLFKDASFDEVVEALEKWYGVKIIVQRGFKPPQSGFQGRYRNESLNTVLEGFAHVSGCDYKIKSDTVYLARKGDF